LPFAEKNDSVCPGEEKMPIDRFRVGLILTALLIVSPSLSFADFIADQFMTISQGELGENQRIMSSKVYSQGKKLRMEMTMAGRNAISISRGDMKPPLFWMLMPDEKMYMETAGEANALDPMSSKTGIKIDKVFVAKENVSGHPANKFKIVWTDKEGKTRSGFAWEAIDLNDAPIRQEFLYKDEHILVQLANIEVKKLDESLFEVPSNYKKISMPPGMQGGPPSLPPPKPAR
jgi:hypothetical protein